MDKPAEIDQDCDGEFKDAYDRRQAFTSGMDPALAEREDSLPKTIRLMNASPPSKLRKIYSLLEEINGSIKPYVACTKGCSACCNMNVTISEQEAKLIQAATGRAYTRQTKTRIRDAADFNGVPCPFLSGSVCSIYADRPYACRSHYSFDTSDYWCHPERSAINHLPMMRFTGADEAYANVVGVNDSGVLADIRDFFPDKA